MCGTLLYLGKVNAGVDVICVDIGHDCGNMT